MVSFIEAIILSIVQGVTEWFPISSSGHLAIVQGLFGFQNLGFDVYLHFASVLAIFIYFKREILDLLRPTPENIRYVIKLIIAVVPVVIGGLFYREYVRYAFTNFLFIGVFFVIFGSLIYATKYARVTKGQPSKMDSFIIGISQVLALFPGISRSGMTMGSGLILGLKKEEAIKFSFFVAIPVIIGASLLQAKEISTLSIPFTTMLTSFTITLLTSLLTIKYLIKIVKIDKFYLFGIYNFIIGFLVIIWSFFR